MGYGDEKNEIAILFPICDKAFIEETLFRLLPSFKFEEKELNLKKATRVVGEKSIEMLKSKELLPLTGYIHGGCSPIGMKNSFLPPLTKAQINLTL